MTARESASVIRTARLLLRPPRPSDAGPIGHYLADPRVSMMTAAIPHPYPPGAAEAWIEGLALGRTGEEAWVIDATPIDWSELVGVISVRLDSGQIGYWIGVPFQGTGFASEALDGLVRHLFATRAVPQLSAEVIADNEASIRVLKKAGFVVTGERMIYSVARAGAVPGLVMVRTPG